MAEAGAPPVVAAALLASATLAMVWVSSARAFDPVVEGRTSRRSRSARRSTTRRSTSSSCGRSRRRTGWPRSPRRPADPEREFESDLCWNLNDGCAGDVRLYDWESNGYGIVKTVLFTARNGATLSGHVWATKAGPERRPGIVITNGSVHADERLYWYAAQTLA